MSEERLMKIIARLEGKIMDLEEALDRARENMDLEEALDRAQKNADFWYKKAHEWRRDG